MNNRKWFGILIITVGMLLLFLIIYFIWFYQWGASQVEEIIEPTTQNQQATQTVLPSESIVKIQNKVTPPEKRELNQEDLKKMAGAFAERFGSYSNHSSYGNVLDLKVFMSKKMQIWADDFVEKSRGEYSGIYYGITTKAITKETQSFNDVSGIAKILVKTQRKESTGDMGNETVFYQNIIIDFIKEDGVWKVDSAFWQ